MTTRLCFVIALASLAAAADDGKSAGILAFRDVASVLVSPRCVNCHVAVDSPPLQGDDSHPHNMRVQRGADGKGSSPAMRCTNCHQPSNSPALHGPPGAPGWSMPASATPMAWQGLSIAQLCSVLKDPRSNGNRSLSDLVRHLESENLVRWAWDPGPGRTLPPLSHAQFIEATKRWAAAGGPCPE